MSRPLRLVLAIALPGVVLLLALSHLQFVLQGIILPVATALWLVLRIFVLSIGQAVYWWGLIAFAVIGVVVFLALGKASRAAPRFFDVSWRLWDPVRQWRDSILRNTYSAPSDDSFRRDLVWLLSALYTSPQPGGALYQVREALQEQRIALPPDIYDFLFASTRPRGPVPPFFKNPGACLQAIVKSLTEARRTRRRSRRWALEYIHCAAEVLSFIETQMEMIHELNPDA